MPDDDTTPPPGDDRLFQVLDEYVEHLHDQDVPSRSVLLERHPELQGLLSCLESLDVLAFEPEAEGPHGPESSATVAWSLDADGDVPRNAQFEAEIDERFGKYELMEELGRGGMGVVFRALQTDLDRTVAVKMILQSRLASADDVRRFYAEARSAGRLRHPNIVGIHEIGQVAGQHYFAMDYVEGLNLAEVLARRKFTADEAAAFVVTVARAVHYLHEHGIVHRDLKPSNILLDEHGTPFVTDFGLAKFFSGDSQDTQSGTIVGTPSYMAPEQAAGRSSHVTPHCDVYSLGAILYELLCGRPPFQRESPLDTLVEVLESEPTLVCKLNPKVPASLQWICLKCLEKDPDNRYASASALADDLERFLQGDPVEAQPAGTGVKLRRWARREPALASRLAGMLLSAMILQINYFSTEINWFAHVLVMGVIAVWAAASVGFQQLLNRDLWPKPTRFAWAGTDVVMLSVLLYLADGPVGPLTIGYPLLIAAAGMFFMVRLVLFTTVMSLLAYAVIIVIHPSPDPGPSHYPVIFAAALAVLGSVIAYQVYRVRVLSRYFESHR